MRTLASFVLCLAAVSGGIFLGAQSANGAIVVPGDSVPGLTSEVFTWDADAAHSTSAFWDDFSGFPGATKPGFLLAGTSPTANTSWDSTDGPSLLTFESNQSLTSGGNAYGGTFGGPSDPSFVTDAFATARSGTSGGDFTRIVVQFTTLGSELDYASILLSPTLAATGTMAPSFAMEINRSLLGGAFGGEQVSYLALWDLDVSQVDFRVDFQAQTSNMSIDKFRVDSFTQSTAFVTPTAVPEPGSLVALGVLAGGGLCLRRARARRRASNHRDV